MFTSLYLDVCRNCTPADERTEGVAFLRAAKSLYGLDGISYLGLNISRKTAEGGYTHCAYSDRAVRQKISPAAIETGKIASLGLAELPFANWRDVERLRIDLELQYCCKENPGTLLCGASFQLAASQDETALFGIMARVNAERWEKIAGESFQEIRILANYFHSHILRLNGNDAGEEMLVSARELDCLKWTAAGKTAWEASVILGIGERTVRFHLNSAREKMKCATTTQAVAKAVSKQMIAL